MLHQPAPGPYPRTMRAPLARNPPILRSALLKLPALPPAFLRARWRRRRRPDFLPIPCAARRARVTGSCLVTAGLAELKPSSRPRPARRGPERAGRRRRSRRSSDRQLQASSRASPASAPCSRGACARLRSRPPTSCCRSSCLLGSALTPSSRCCSPPRSRPARAAARLRAHAQLALLLAPALVPSSRPARASRSPPARSHARRPLVPRARAVRPPLAAAGRHILHLASRLLISPLPLPFKGVVVRPMVSDPTIFTIRNDPGWQG